MMVHLIDSESDEMALGISDGLPLGSDDGSLDGESDGIALGISDGLPLGSDDGLIHS